MGGTSLNNEVVSTLGITALAEPATAPAVARIGEALLEIEDLNVQFVTSHGTVRAVEGLSYTVHPGEMVAIVGESGSGKSVSALAVMQLLPSGTARTRGSIRFGGRELLGLTDEEMRRIRGREIAMIFQEPMTSLNPVLRIGLQITEPLTIHLEHGREGGARPGDRAADAGRHHRSRKPAQPVSASAVRRHAPARDDRHRSCLQSRSC